MEQRQSLQGNGLLEGGLGLFLPSDNNPQDEQIPYDELLRRGKKKKTQERVGFVAQSIVDKNITIKNQRHEK